MRELIQLLLKATQHKCELNGYGNHKIPQLNCETGMRQLAFILINLFFILPAAAEDQVVLPEVKVTAKTDDITERRAASTQKLVLERKDIENLGVMTIGEVLGKLPGVELPTGSDGAARARGMTRDSVDIRVDGERPAGGSRIVSGVVGRLPSGDLERVEILRGSSAEFGGSAPVTVNLVMKKALPKRSTAIKAALGLNGSTATGQFTFTQNGGEGGFAWSLPVTLNLHRSPTQRETGRQDTTAGTRTLWQKENEDGSSSFRELVLSPRMTWKYGSDSLSVSPLFFDGLRKRGSYAALSAYANPVGETEVAYNGDRASHENNHRRLMRLRAEGEKRIGEAKLSGRVALNGGRLDVDVIRGAHNAANVLTTSTENTHSSEHELNSALRWDQPVGLHLLSLGAEYVKLMRNENQNFGGSFVAQGSHSASSRDGILWIQDDWTLQTSVTLTTGLRAESMGLNAEGVSQQHLGWLPSVAVRWEPADKWVMRSSLGAGLKMPKVDEISNATTRSVAINTPVEADRRGNPNLHPERSVNFEAVLERYLAEDAGVLGANLYIRSTRDFTERRVQLEGLRWVDRPNNEGNALHWGTELDGKLRTDSLGWKGATVKAHLTLPHARVNDTRLGITRMARDTPRYVFSTGLDQSLPKLQSSYGISLQLSGRSETDIPGEQRVLTKSKTTLDAFWLYKLTPQFNLRLNGQNLLVADTVRETEYTSIANAWQLRTMEGGYRTVMATVEGRW